MTRTEAMRLRAAMEQAAPSLDDKTASTAADMFPQLKYDGSLVKVWTRINWNGIVKRAAADLWDRIENNPDNAKYLWEDLLYIDGVRIIPEVITAGTAFAQGEEVGGRAIFIFRFSIPMFGLPMYILQVGR